MNKIMEREYDYIRGNTAVNPNRKYKDFNENKKNREIERLEKEKRKRLRELRDKKTKEVIQVALVVCVLSVATIMREGNVYKTQQELTNIKTEAKNIEAANGALKVELFKFSSLDNIKSTAESIGMVNPNSSEAITIDMSKNYFPELTKDAMEKEGKENLFSKIRDALKK